MTTTPTDAEERVAVRVWQLPVRIIHWLLVADIVLLSVTGLYIGAPVVTLGAAAPIMVYMKALHAGGGLVFVGLLLARVIFAFTGNRYARWDQFIPVRREQRKNLLPSVSFYMFRTRQPPPVIGHNPLAGATYTVLFAMFAVQALTGLALKALEDPGGWMWAISAWIFGVLPVGTVRLVHHLILYCTWGVRDPPRLLGRADGQRGTQRPGLVHDQRHQVHPEGPLVTGRPPVLAVGIGNELCGDEGLGVAAARRLAGLGLDGVEVLDGGTLGLALLPAVADRDALLVLDAMTAAGARPGEVLLLHDEEVTRAHAPLLSAHQLGIAQTLATADLAGRRPPLLAAVGMVPARVAIGYGLSPLVTARLDGLVARAVSVLRDWGVGEHAHA